MISDISFIVIARNEAFGVDKCLAALSALPLHDCEVICVDSASTDATADIMAGYRDRFETLKVIRVSGFVNAAVARNAGLPHATKDLVFFLDGDVALSQAFLEAALNRISTDRTDAVTGPLHEIQYTPDYRTILRELTRRTHIRQEKRCLMTGGIFLARRSVVDRLGPWDARLWRLQDFEYTLRLTRAGRLLQLPENMGVHHTQEYHDRSWAHFLQGYPRLYGHLIRQNIDRADAVRALFRGNRGLLTFSLLLVAVIGLLGLAGLGLVPGWTVPAGAALLVLADATYSLGRKGDTLRTWIRHGYLEPPFILYGIMAPLRRPNESAPETRTEVVVG